MIEKVKIEGWVIEGLPFLFETERQAQVARFPSRLPITGVEEEEEVSND